MSQESYIKLLIINTTFLSIEILSTKKMPLASFPVATEKEGFEVRPDPKKALRKGVFRMSPLKFGINFGIKPSFLQVLLMRGDNQI